MRPNHATPILLALAFLGLPHLAPARAVPDLEPVTHDAAATPADEDDASSPTTEAVTPDTAPAPAAIDVSTPEPISETPANAARATLAASSVDHNLRFAIAWQLSLEAAGFSPGLIDGRLGPKTTHATTEFQRARGLTASGTLDDATKQLLTLPGADVLTTYTITPDDRALVTGTFKDWNAKAAADLLGYETLADCVAERFHTNARCLAALNPGVELENLKVGDKLLVPDLGDNATPGLVKDGSGNWTLRTKMKSTGRAARAEVNLTQKTIRVFDNANKVIALFHCSIAADKAKRPAGEATVQTVAICPQYTFNPKMWPEVHNVDRILQIPAGPRNPVGLAWTGLSLPGYGMHGTPKPDQIGKTGSHGCFRLTNWDAIRLAHLVRVGMPVSFSE